ncbi:glycoside hydrolase family 71 protein [Tulasnella calospora MUT 4182]|uniref:Glycoside hydrolase family 71 protein n=1 Tax=Tulasnella calospora MUT 4182 TaxID=1051891 RepID=A0A0C3QKE0_9AGAM|nr:glycoside hydrolase family 71 protein [Tulasnella calospora MUT 4182]
MVGNTYSYTSSTWATQIALAKAQGIDAFVLNFGSPSWELDRMQDGYNAAATAGFKMFLSFDMTSLTCTSTADANSISSTIVRWANHAAQLKDSNGAVYVGTFSGENCYFGQGDFATGWIQAVKTGPRNSGVTTKFIPSFFPVNYHGAMFTSFMDGVFPWNNAWPMGNYDISWSSDVSTLSSVDRTHGQVYMAPISPWFFTHYGQDTWNKNWIYRADDWMYSTRWEQLITNRASVDLVQIITWNDYGESHYIGPIGQDQPNSNAWVDGFDHTAWSTISGYYIQAYKTGVAPTIIQDKIYMWARPHGKSDNAPNDNYIGRPNNADWTDDYLWIVLFSTGSGTLQVTQGSSQATWQVTAGVNKLKLASGVTSSGVTATLTRGSAQVFSYFAPITFTHSPSTYNFNAFVFSGP